ncbi:MAG: MDR family oxidoreductase [Rhodothermales bacterium]
MNALFLEKKTDGMDARVRPVADDAWPAGDVTVRIAYSSINYKDALAVTGRGKIVRGAFPFIPGIDFAGEVIGSDDPRYPVGRAVIGTGWGIGEERWGGYSQLQRVEASMLVPLPEAMTPFEAMAAGTAGLTAMLSALALERHGVAPDAGPIVVTGATGGVGSFSVRILSSLGYAVTASTGKADAGPYLRDLGAAEVIGRDELGQGPRRPLDAGRWAGAVDSVGGNTLAAILSQTARHGCVAACGLAGAAEFSTTVFPFILRGVTLQGIDSNTCTYADRVEAWDRLSALPRSETFERHLQTVPLSGVPAACEALMRGGVTGRFVVDVNG